MLVFDPQGRAWFLPAESPAYDLWALAVPDAVLLMPGSLLAGALIHRQHRWAIPVTFVVAGAMVYVALYSVAWATLGQGAWPGALLMTSAALVASVFALEIAADKMPVFRQARDSTTLRNIFKTLIQIILFWSVFLWIVPRGVMFAEEQFGLKRFAFSGQQTIAVVLFLILGGMGVYCGLAMAVYGSGTPLPLDSPRRLVVVGPYRYVRNPMATTSLGQGMCVAIGAGSWVTVGYVILGGLIWNFIVSSAEEADLRRRFDDTYVAYQQSVRCWWPRITPYKPAP